MRLQLMGNETFRRLQMKKRGQRHFPKILDRNHIKDIFINRARNPIATFIITFNPFIQITNMETWSQSISSLKTYLFTQKILTSGSKGRSRSPSKYTLSQRKVMLSPIDEAILLLLIYAQRKFNISYLEINARSNIRQMKNSIFQYNAPSINITKFVVILPKCS